MLHPGRHHVHLSRSQVDVTIAQFDAQLPFQHYEGLVGIRVVVPHEFPLQLRQFELVIVHFCYDPRRPVVVEKGQFFGKIDGFIHRGALRDAGILAESYGLSFPTNAAPPPEGRVRRAHAVLLEPRSAEDQLQLAIELGEAVWQDEGEALAAIVERHGGISGESVRPALYANYEALERAGHYQPGMLYYGGDWYWGIDRLCHLEARLRHEGLEGSLGLSAGPSPHLASMITATATGQPSIEVFISFRSPYSYVALPQFIALRDRFGIGVKVRPVLPMVMRGLEVPKAKRLYIAHDAKREADRLGVPFGHVCDPLGKGIAYCMAVFFQCADGKGNELYCTREP